jgi:hypothetical protein
MGFDATLAREEAAALRFDRLPMSYCRQAAGSSSAAAPWGSRIEVSINPRSASCSGFRGPLRKR